jgi:GAF domain-containing protein
MMRDRDTGELHTLVARNWNSESLSESDVVFSRNVVQMALERGEPVLTTNAKDDTRLKFYESVIDNDMRSILCIPLTMRGDVVGVLYADNRLTQDVFKAEKVPLLAAFGAQAAIAIENAQAFGQVKRDLDRALTELENLQIQIDHKRVDEQVNEIVESDYFQQLASAAKSMRSRYTEGGEQ